MTKIPRVYLDTSVIGGCFDQEFALWSNLLMKNFRSGWLKPVVSTIIAVELAKAPGNVQTIFGELLALSAEILPTSVEAVTIANLYQ